MKKKNALKIVSMLLLLMLILSFVGCTDNTEPETDIKEPESEDTTKAPDEKDTDTHGKNIPGTELEIHSDLKLVYENSEEGLYAYATEKPLDDMFLYYNKLPIFKSSLEFEAVPDVFLLQTELYELIMTVDGAVMTDPDSIKAFEEKLLEAYQETNGVMLAIGVRGGATDFYGMLPEEVHSEIPKDGSFVMFGVMTEAPEIDN